MALLTTQQRTQVWRAIMRRWSMDHTECSLLSAALYNPVSDTGVIAEIDAWRDSHAGNVAPDTVGFNGAINPTARAVLSANQKTDIFLAVVAMSRGIDYVRSVFGEVD